MSAHPITPDRLPPAVNLEAMNAIIRMREAIEKHGGIRGIEKGLSDVSRDLKAIVDLDALARDAPEGTLTDAWIRDNLQFSSALLRSINELMENAKRSGFANLPALRSALDSISNSRLSLAEHIDILELSTDPEVEELIRRGRQDFAEGRGIPLESLLDE